MPLITLTDAGLYCPEGDFYLDPWLPVNHAVTTHAHAEDFVPQFRHQRSSVGPGARESAKQLIVYVKYRPLIGNWSSGPLPASRPIQA